MSMVYANTHGRVGSYLLTRLFTDVYVCPVIQQIIEAQWAEKCGLHAETYFKVCGVTGIYFYPLRSF